MLIVRPATVADLDPLFELVQLSEYGLTTLQVSKDKLRERVEQSALAFRQSIARPQGQPYVFVMEDLANGRIVGTSAIYSKVGGYEPFYSYEIRKEIKESRSLGVYKEIPYLYLNSEHDGPTELGSLFLAPDYWGAGHGRLLSMSRFLFMAEFPERFERETIADMRGVVRADGHSPLWDALGSHFFQIEFPKADTLSSESKTFIGELMPRHPIYIPLLPVEAQQVIGQVHPNARPALAMLKKEGFEQRNLVDIFDGGPTLHCATRDIRAVRASRRGTVAAVRETVEGPRLLISNARADFRATLGPVSWSPTDEAVIDNLTALQLNLQVGQPVRTVSIRPDDETASDSAGRTTRAKAHSENIV